MTAGDSSQGDVPTEFAFPGVLGEIARLTTVEIATIIARKRGGGKMHFGQYLPRNHVLISLVGRQAALLIHQHFQGHGSIKIPSAKTYLNWHRARQLRRQGKTIRAIAEKTGLSMRRVEQLLERFPVDEVGAAALPAQPASACPSCGRRACRPKISGACDDAQGDLFSR
jgi:lambda repressor-like predicted transcriptional regulator